MRSLAALLCLAAAAHAAPAEPPRQLTSLTLKQAIGRALTLNPRVLQQIEELYRAEAQVEEVRATALPTLNGNGLYTRIDGARVFTSAASGSMPAMTETLQGTDAVSANLVAAVPLLAPRRWVQWAHARTGAGIGSLDVGDIKRQVAIAVATAYLQIITRKRELELNGRARDTARAHADYTHARLLGGMGSRLDDTRAQQELEADEGLVVASRLALMRAQETLGVLVATEGPVDAAEEPWFAAVDPTQAAADAPKLRVDLLALDARRGLAGRILHDDWADYMPALTATFAPLYSWPSTIFTPTWSWQFQLVLTVPLYDGGLRYGLAKERRALVREATLAQEAALRQTRSELRIGGEAVDQTEEALGRARRAAQLAHEALRIADLAYRAGATTNIELIDAERRARDADTGTAIAEDAARQARLDVLFAAGRLP